MKIFEVLKRALKLWKNNIVPISIMAGVLAVMQSAITLVTLVTPLEISGFLTLLLNMLVLGPIIVGNYNGIWKIIEGEKLEKSHIFRWIGDIEKLFWGIRVEAHMLLKFLWITIIYGRAIGLTASFMPSIMALVLYGGMIFLIIKMIRLIGGVIECARQDDNLKDNFNKGVFVMSKIIGKSICIALLLFPIMLIFEGPLLYYTSYVTQETTNIFWGLSLLSIVGSAFITAPMLEISSVVLYKNTVEPNDLEEIKEKISDFNM